MSTVYNASVKFDGLYTGTYVLPDGSNRSYGSVDGLILCGGAVTLSDQQHENNHGVNYLSYFVKHVSVRGKLRVFEFDRTVDFANKARLTVVLYKVSVKHENGRFIPLSHTKGFTQLKDYLLYSIPQCVLAWDVFHIQFVKQEPDLQYIETWTFDYSLFSNKKVVLGPYDVLCCNLLLDHPYTQKTTYEDWDCVSKVVFDIN